MTEKFKIVLETQSPETLRFEVDLLIHACNHMIDVYDTDVKRHRQYATSYAEQTNKETVQNHINSGIAMIGHYQRIKERLEKNLKVVTHNAS